MTKGLLLLAFAVASVSAHADKVFSRSIMDSCQFVYRVESDVRVQPSPELFEIYAGAPLLLRAKFKNILKKGPAESQEFLIPVGDNATAEFTFESMSTANDYLYRDMTFEWGVKVEDGSFFSLSNQYHSDIGREFGENCNTQRGQSAVFVERIIRE